MAEYSQVRTVALDMLRSPQRPGSINLYDTGDATVRGFFRGKGLALAVADLNTFCDVFLDFCKEGIIAPGQGGASADQQGLCFPQYRITAYGKQVLESTEYVPYDPDGYLAKLKSDIPTIDAIIVRYLDEGLRCMKANHLLAASVMIGCAAEKAMILFIEAFGNAITSAAAKTSYERATKPWMIKTKYVALWDRIQKPAVQAQLPANLKDDLQTLLDRVFDLIRTTRNEAGHPTGKAIEKETVHANLLLFPSYCKRVYGLMTFFAGTPPAL